MLFRKPVSPVGTVSAKAGRMRLPRRAHSMTWLTQSSVRMPIRDISCMTRRVRLSTRKLR